MCRQAEGGRTRSSCAARISSVASEGPPRRLPTRRISVSASADSHTAFSADAGPRWRLPFDQVAVLRPVEHRIRDHRASLRMRCGPPGRRVHDRHGRRRPADRLPRAEACLRARRRKATCGSGRFRGSALRPRRQASRRAASATRGLARAAQAADDDQPRCWHRKQRAGELEIGAGLILEFAPGFLRRGGTRCGRHARARPRARP